jgi:hypothetical protein
MLYSKRRKNLGGGRKKRSNRKFNIKRMRGGGGEMKVHFFPLSSRLADDSDIKDIMRWLSPDKQVSLLLHNVIKNEQLTDRYWAPNNSLGIPNWKEGTHRKNNYEKAIRNLQRLIHNKMDGITHFTISDASNTYKYEGRNDSYEAYAWGAPNWLDL